MKSGNKTAILPAIGVLGVLLLIFVFVLFPSIWKETARGIEILDIRWSYTTHEVSDLFDILGENGLSAYILFLLTDSIYSLIYTSLLILSLTFLQSKMGRLGTITSWMRWLPIGVMVLDLTENTIIWILISNYPQLSSSVVVFGSVVTMLKWYAASTCVGLVICSILAVLLRNMLWKIRNIKS